MIVRLARPPVVVAWALILVSSSAAGAVVDVSWTGNGSTSLWGEAANWDPMVVPDNGVDEYRVTIGAGAGTVGLISNVEVNHVEVAFGTTLVVEQDFDIAAGAGNGIENNGTVQIGGPGLVARIRFKGDAELAGIGTFVFGGDVSSGASIGTHSSFSPGDLISIPATADLDFEALNPGTSSGRLSLISARWENAGSLNFRMLDNFRLIGAASGTNTGAISFVDCTAADVSFSFDSNPTRGTISISGPAGGPEALILKGDLNDQDVTITTQLVRASFEPLTLTESTVGGTLLVGFTSNLTIDENPASATGDFHLILDGDLAYLGAEPSGNLTSIQVAANVDISGQLTLSRNLAISGGSRLNGAQLSLDLAGNELSVSEAGTVVNIGGVVDMNNGIVTVTSGAEIEIRNRFDGSDGGRLAVTAPAKARLKPGGELQLLDLEIPGQTLIGEGGTLRSVEIPVGAELTGYFVIEDGIELNGKILLGTVDFNSVPTISGNGEFEFPPGSTNLGQNVGDSFSIAPSAVLSMVGGNGVVKGNMLNDGRLKVLAQGIKFDRLARNSGSVEVSEGTTEVGGISDNTGGVIEATGNGRIEIDDTADITGGTIRNNADKSLAAGVAGAGSAVSLSESRLKNVTLEGLIEVLPGDGSDPALSLDTSLTNNGVLLFQRNTEMIEVVTSADGGPGSAFELLGAGSIDFGDGSVATPVNPDNELLRFVAVPDQHISNRGNTLRGNALIGAKFLFSNTEVVNEGLIVVDDPIGLEFGVIGQDTTNSGRIEVAAGGRLDIPGNFFNDGQMQLAGGGSIEGNSIFTNQGALTAAPGSSFGSFNFTMQSGNATIAGDLITGSVVQNGGTLQLGPSTLLSTLTLNGGAFNVGRPTLVTGTFFMGPQASLVIDVGGAVPDLEHDRLRTNTTNLFANSTYDGSLIVRTDPGYTPVPGTLLQVIEFVGQRNGTEFAQVVNQSAYPAVTFQPQYNGDSFGNISLLLGGDPSIVVEADVQAAAGQCAQSSGPNRTHDYVVVIRNDGTDPAENIALDMFLPVQVQLNPVPMLPPECTQNGSQVNCTFTVVGVDQSVAVPFGVTVNAGAAGTLTLSASAIADQSDPAPGNNSTALQTALVADLIELDGFESCDGS